MADKENKLTPRVQKPADWREDAIELAKENSALRAELKVAHITVGFFASVIKSGEPWTDACQAARDKVFGPDSSLAEGL